MCLLCKKYLCLYLHTTSHDPHSALGMLIACMLLLYQLPGSLVPERGHTGLCFFLGRSMRGLNLLKEAHSCHRCQRHFMQLWSCFNLTVSILFYPPTPLILCCPQRKLFITTNP